MDIQQQIAQQIGALVLANIQLSTQVQELQKKLEALEQLSDTKAT